MDMLNVFKYKTYSRNPIKNIRNFFQKIKYIYQRASKGYCDWDLYDLDNFYLNLLSKSIKEFADKIKSMPYNMTEEEWDGILNETSVCFYNANENNDVYKNPYNINTEKENYFECEKENWERRTEQLQKGMKLFSKHIRDLWS